MYQIANDTIISDILMNAPQCVPMFQAIGMHCMGCALSSGENVEQACAAHGVDVDAFVAEVNEFLAKEEF